MSLDCQNSMPIYVADSVELHAPIGADVLNAQVGPE